MKNMKIACIGAGNMGEAMLRGLVRSRSVVRSKVRASDRAKDRLAKLATELKIKTFTDNKKAAAGADLVLLAVKPQILDRVIKEIKEVIKPDALVISVAAGYPTALIESLLGNKPHVVRAMPNIAAMVGQAATAICAGKWAKKADMRIATRLFETCGTCTQVDEQLMDAVTGLSGTGPMYVFIIIEALSDAGVRVGLGRKTATELAIQTVMGAARMLRDTGQHPIFLKDMVTSPGGTAITALYSMEKTGLRAVLMDAVEAATQRSSELGRPIDQEN
jgi:pyrroline-5-carboxylate reductase